MRIPTLALISLLLVGLLPSAATAAVELDNEDGAAYTIRVQSPSMTRDLLIASHQWTAIVCMSGCVFSAEGMGRVAAGSDDKLVIRNGRLVRVEFGRK